MGILTTKVGFTGTSKGMTDKQRAKLNELLNNFAGEFHHGDCIGADADAHDSASSYGYWVVLHPPTNPRKRAFKIADEVKEPKPYLERNRDIVDETAILFATPYEFDEQQRSGTWATIRYARKLKRPVTIIFPDGSVECS